MKEKFKVSQIRDLLNQVYSEKITFSRFVEILNEQLENKMKNEFHLEESKVNKDCMILVFTDNDKQKWVIGGDHHNPTYATKYEDSFDTKPLENK